jgi:hypothetical protein
MTAEEKPVYCRRAAAVSNARASRSRMKLSPSSLHAALNADVTRAGDFGH